jgi:hypothetical protein
MTEHKYPTKKILQTIKKMEVNDSQTYHAFMEYVKDNWEFSEWGFHRDGDTYCISTGGWSGNEDIITAMKRNTMFWMLHWSEVRRGGHYIFAPMTLENIDKLSKQNPFETINKLHKAIVWALGYTDFGMTEKDITDTHKHNRYWWRSELRERAGLTYEQAQKIAESMKES